jgi:hypothetical protein
MTNEQLTTIYNHANGIDKKNPPITTERIFTAMRHAMAIECQACAAIADKYHTPMCDGVADLIAAEIRARNTV